MDFLTEKTAYDRAAMTAHTRKRPTWIHFGAGNIFRGYIAGIADQLLNVGATEEGIIAAETFDDEIVTRGMRPYDNLCMGVVLKADGTLKQQVIGSVAESFTMADHLKIRECFCAPSLQIVSFTVTEKGYRLFAEGEEFLPPVWADMQAGPGGRQASFIGFLTSLCYHRYQNGAYPVALLSLDNCSRNGQLLSGAVTAIAEKWVSFGKAEPEFLDYLQDHTRVAFPWSMIDRITPAPSEAVAEMIGVKKSEIIQTSKHTAVAPFVNMEEYRCLVVEDDFPNGRPPLEKAGVLLCDRETVEKCESMKVYTCLNPLHTALALLGCLLGFSKISEEMQDSDLSAFIQKLGYGEMLPVAVDPGILNAKEFLDSVVKSRLVNPFVPDTPQRIASDTSQKMPVRYGNAVLAHKKKGTLEGLEAIPFVIAAWCRYLTGINDSGNLFVQSHDPCLEELKTVVGGLAFGADIAVCEAVVKQIATARYFVEELPESLQKKAAAFLCYMLEKPGAVRQALHQLVL